MPTFRSGHLTAVAFAGFDASPYLNNAEASRNITASEVSHFQSSAKEFIGGPGTGTVSLSGMYDATKVAAGVSLGTVHEAITAITTDTAVTLFFDGGAAVGRRCVLAGVIASNYVPGTPVGGAATLKLDLQVNGTLVDGYCLTPYNTPIVTATTVNNASVDNTALSSAGGIATIHTVANTWTGNTTVKIQHSVDNSAWVDLITQVVPASTAAGYILTVAGTVNRYTRAIVTTAAGSGSVNVLAAFARN